MEDALLEVLITLPPQVAIAWGFTRVLPMRFAPLFVAANATAVTALNAVGHRYLGVWAGMALLLVVGFVLPFLLYRGPRLLRAVVVVAANVCDNLAHGVEFAVCAALMGSPVPDDMGPYYDAARANPGSFAVSEFVCIAVSIGLFMLLAGAVRKHREGEGFVHGWITCAFLLTQAAFMVESLIVLAHFDVSAGRATTLCLLLAGCLVADVLLIRGMGRYRSLVLERERGDGLERQLRESLASYGEVVEAIGRTGRVRHDLRNHLQAVQGLAASGQVERAREHVDALRRALEGGEGGGSR